MPFPNFRKKHYQDSIVNPKEALDYFQKIFKSANFAPPIAIIFCYSEDLMEEISNQHLVTTIKRPTVGRLSLVNQTKGRVAILGNFGIGAPMAVIRMEEFAALGVKKFITIGTAGTLQKNLQIGDIVVCKKAIRDEGTSYHYLKPSKYAYASEEMTERIKESLEKMGKKYTLGTSWTIDAPYRETVAEAKHYQAEGVLTVEMEAAALFAVGKFRHLEVGALFAVSDSLAELEWVPHLRSPRTMKGLRIIYQVALDVLSQ
jgi:uridine phosphorylase